MAAVARRGRRRLPAREVQGHLNAQETSVGAHSDTEGTAVTTKAIAASEAALLAGAGAMCIERSDAHPLDGPRAGNSRVQELDACANIRDAGLEDGQGADVRSLDALRTRHSGKRIRGPRPLTRPSKAPRVFWEVSEAGSAPTPHRQTRCVQVWDDALEQRSPRAHPRSHGGDAKAMQLDVALPILDLPISPGGDRQCTHQTSKVASTPPQRHACDSDDDVALTQISTRFASRIGKNYSTNDPMQRAATSPFRCTTIRAAPALGPRHKWDVEDRAGQQTEPTVGGSNSRPQCKTKRAQSWGPVHIKKSVSHPGLRFASRHQGLGHRALCPHYTLLEELRDAVRLWDVSLRRVDRSAGADDCCMVDLASEAVSSMHWMLVSAMHPYRGRRRFAVAMLRAVPAMLEMAIEAFAMHTHRYATQEDPAEHVGARNAEEFLKCASSSIAVRSALDRATRVGAEVCDHSRCVSVPLRAGRRARSTSATLQLDARAVVHACKLAPIHQTDVLERAQCVTSYLLGIRQDLEEVMQGSLRHVTMPALHRCTSVAVVAMTRLLAVGLLTSVRARRREVFSRCAIYRQQCRATKRICSACVPSQGFGIAWSTMTTALKRVCPELWTSVQRFAQLIEFLSRFEDTVVRSAAIEELQREGLREVCRDARLEWCRARSLLRQAASTRRMLASQLAALRRLRAATVETLVAPLPAVNLTASDWARLEDGQHLNDALLDFFIRLLVRTFGGPRVHAFSSLFFSRLSSQGVQDGTQGWANVETWTRGMRRASALGIFACDFLFVPIHDARAKHWSLAVISRPWAAAECSGVRAEATVSFLDSCAPNAQAEAQVMHFIRGYLASEWNSVGCGAYDAEDLTRISVDAPQQNNDSDCGVFVLEFVLQLLRNQHLLDLLGREPVDFYVPGLPRKRWRRAGAALRAVASAATEQQVRSRSMTSWLEVLSEDRQT